MSNWKPDVVIYHSPCDDGFGAAWAAYQQWGDSIDYLPASYGNLAPDVAGKNVLIVDFSYKRGELETLAQSAASIVVLDHHKTALEDLAAFQRFGSNPQRFTLATVASMISDLTRGGYLPICALFDMNRSGARMTWEFCNPADPAPELIRLIEDRDLWRFEIPETRAFTLYLRTLTYDFYSWSLLADFLEKDRFGVMAQAAAIEAFYDRRIERMVQSMRLTTIGGFTVPTVNCPSDFSSDVGHALLKAHPNMPFAACYCDGTDRRGYSLRSEDHRVDVSGVAAKLGGGGHRNAAGFAVPLP